MSKNKVVPIQKMILEIRGHKVMLDRDLAELYEVELKAMNRTVKRNIKRFPSDFMFQLKEKEWNNLRCQFGTAKYVEKIRYNPYVFTEQGVAMLSGLVNSDIAIKVNIQIMRAFIKLRQFALSQINTNKQITELRKLLMLHIDNTDFKLSEHEEAINGIINALNNLIEKPKETRRIGFCTD